MGLFDAIGDTFDFIASPILAGLVGGPSAAVSEISRKGLERKFEKSEFERYNEMQDLAARNFGSNRGGVPLSNNMPMRTNNSFFGGLRENIVDFGRDVGGFVSDIAPALDLFGIGNRPSAAATTIIRQPPDETSSSGELLGANLGMGTSLINAASRFARSPAGGSLIGGGLGFASGAMTGSGSGAPRITRRMKADVRRIYMMAGMDPNATAQILNNLGTYPRMNFDTSLVFFILTKRFRNDGPVVTKAAVRKTKTTLRRMKGVVDMYNSVCKPTTRRAPARRAAPKAVQLIKN